MGIGKQVWFVLDEIVTKCSASHGEKPCPICAFVIRRMRLFPKPSPTECRELYLKMLKH